MSLAAKIRAFSNHFDGRTTDGSPADTKQTGQCFQICSVVVGSALRMFLVFPNQKTHGVMSLDASPSLVTLLSSSVIASDFSASRDKYVRGLELINLPSSTTCVCSPARCRAFPPNTFLAWSPLLPSPSPSLRSYAHSLSFDIHRFAGGESPLAPCRSLRVAPSSILGTPVRAVAVEEL